MAVGLVVTGVLASGGPGEAASCKDVLVDRSYLCVVNGVATQQLAFQSSGPSDSTFTATFDENVQMLCTCEVKKVYQQLDASLLKKQFVCAAGSEESVLVITGKAGAKKIKGQIVTTTTVSGVASPSVIQCAAP